MPYIKKGIECKSEGCCVSPQKYGSPESLSQADKPDTRYPRLWKEILFVVASLPKGIAFFIRNVFAYAVLRRRKLPTWNRSTSMTIIMLHTVRCVLQKNSLAFWRIVLSIPSNSSTLKKYRDASFTAEKLNLPGILKDHDVDENGERRVKAQWLFPETTEDGKVILYLHGGGYCVKDWKAYLSITTRLAASVKSPIFCVSYRLAPETRFPGALIDAVQSYFYLIKNLKYDPENIIVLGDSAGGGLTLSLLLYLRDHAFPLPHSSILLSPWVDLTYSHQSWLDAAAHDVLPSRPADNALVNPGRHYLGPKQYSTLSKHPYASPLFASTFEDLPPILIQYGSREIMSDEVRSLVKKLKSCQNTVFRSEEYEDMLHVFQAFTFPEVEVAFKRMKTFMDCDINDIGGLKGEFFYGINV